MAYCQSSGQQLTLWVPSNCIRMGDLSVEVSQIKAIYTHLMFHCRDLKAYPEFGIYYVLSTYMCLCLLYVLLCVTVRFMGVLHCS